MKKILFTFLAALCCTVMNAQSALVITDTNGKEYYVIETAAELVNFAKLVNEGKTSANAVLMADIKLNDGVLNSDGTLKGTPQTMWTPIGHGVDYAGEFNGNGHTISGLYFKNETVNNVGLFGKTVDNAYIHDLGITDSYFYGLDHVGGICGDFANGKIENCWSEVAIYVASGDGGGLTGSVFTNAVLKNCYSICSVDGNGSRGLVCGALTGTIENCYARQINSTGTTIVIGWTSTDGPHTATKVEIKTAEAFASGEVCHLLNNGTTDGTQAFYQTLTKDSNPVLDIARMTVFKTDDGSYTNAHITGNVSFVKNSLQLCSSDIIILQESEEITNSLFCLDMNSVSSLIIPEDISLQLLFQDTDKYLHIDEHVSIYVFGSLLLYYETYVFSPNIYLMNNGGRFYDYSLIGLEYTKHDDVSPTVKKITGRKPTSLQPGWKDYYIQGIEYRAEHQESFWQCNNDYYEDADCTKKIEDLEAWKKGNGRIDALLFRVGNKMYAVNDNGSIYGSPLAFTDKEAYQSNCDVTVGGWITYYRTFTNTNWQPLYVPFAMSYSEWKDNFDVAAINNFHEYTDADGKTVKTELEVRLVKDHTLKPNHPYLIRAKNADEYSPQIINLSTHKIYKSEAKSIDCSSTEWKYTFAGTYNELTNLKTNGYIFMSGGNLCKANNDDVALSPQRWYMTIESRGSQIDEDSSANAKAMQFDIKLLDDEATGIDEITVTRTPLHSSSDAIYNLNGMRVNEGYKGIVIQNGKKVYRK